MRELYIKQVKKALAMPHKQKKAVLRDLNEAFASALEHGETERQVMERLGSPTELAQNMAELPGHNKQAQQTRKRLVRSIAALGVAALSFIAYFASAGQKLPQNVIGQADAMTGIAVEAALAFDALPLLLVLGAAALVFAGVQIVALIRKKRQEATR